MREDKPYCTINFNIYDIFYNDKNNILFKEFSHKFILLIYNIKH